MNRMKYDMIFVTNLPAFYKLNLYNRIAAKKKIYVVFIGRDRIVRNEDFLRGDRNFEHIILSNYSVYRRFVKLVEILIIYQYNKVVIGGWDSVWCWASAFLSCKRHNAVVVESSHWESKTIGFVGLIKRFFLSRISVAYVSGFSQKRLIENLNFKGKYIVTQGVGIINISVPPIYQEKSAVRKFIYVGRLSKEKNLPFLIHTFNQFPDLILNIVGFGPLEGALKIMAQENIIFHGAVDNKELPIYYKENDIFILPSLVEPWGLVVEEALNNGLPVIVSERVGCAEQIVINDKNGIVFSLSDPNSLKTALLKVTNVEYYNQLRKNVCNMDFVSVCERQVNSYL